MKKLSILFLFALMAVFSSCSQNESVNQYADTKVADHTPPDNLVLVKGGIFVNTQSNLFGTRAKIADFYIGKYEITQKEWVEVMGSNPSKFRGDNLPVESVTWYDCIEYCNARSIKEGLT